MTRRRLKITPVLVTLNVLVLLLIVAFYGTRMIKYYLKENGKSNYKRYIGQHGNQSAGSLLQRQQH